MKILNFGSCNIDLVYSLDHIVRAGETISAETMQKFVGGKGLNQSVALANAGVPVCHAGCVGADGDMLADFMERAGVDLTYLKRVDETTGQAIIQVDNSGENSIILFTGANHCITAEHIDEVLAGFGEGDYIVLQNEINNLEYIISRAAEVGMKIFLNPAPFTEEIRRIGLDKIYCLIVNEIEAAGLSGASGTDGFVKFLKENHPQLSAVITLGKKGSVYVDGDLQIRQSAFVTEAVDTTAAGDTFVGYFVAELSRGKSPANALRTASIASAITVSRPGAAPSIPKMDEVVSSKLSPSTSVDSDLQKEKVLAYLEGSYSSASLSKLANMLGYSESYATRWIKRTLGKSFSALLCEKRCAVAADMLKNTDVSIKDIISHVGYSNESFFRKTFSSIYGQNPAKYRQSFRK